jgi:hypothetical protein
MRHITGSLPIHYSFMSEGLPTARFLRFRKKKPAITVSPASAIIWRCQHQLSPGRQHLGLIGG